ncbi:MAG: hypothetical protein KDB57_02085 [Solirubrobacterales bacterium]|jgi:hypothetical protein|nr:hypothetical protein [Solirubrobacterales bacterium]
MSDPEVREGEESTEVEESPVPARDEKFGLNLGNPLESEGAAFSWLVVVIIAAVSIGAVAKLISPLASVLWTLILLGILAVPIFKGLRHQLGSPDEDE